MKGHRLKYVGSAAHCTCGAFSHYNVSTLKQAHDVQRGHIRLIHARMILDGLPQGLDLPSIIETVLDWAARDQDECRQCGDLEGEREALTNLKCISGLRRVLPALLTVAGYRQEARQ